MIVVRNFVGRARVSHGKQAIALEKEFGFQIFACLKAPR
jgi:hypothetical protein